MQNLLVLSLHNILRKVLLSLISKQSDLLLVLGAVILTVNFVISCWQNIVRVIFLFVAPVIRLEHLQVRVILLSF